MNDKDSAILEEAIKPLIRQDLLEDTDSNCNIIWFLYNEFLSQKISAAEFRELSSALLKKPNFFDKFHANDLPVQPHNQHMAIIRRRRSVSWSLEEDEHLKQAVQELGTSDWGAIVKRVGNNRTKAQCSQRWNRVLDPNINKANWTIEEQEKLLAAVKAIGEKSWKRVAAQLENRTDVQCRFKYFHIKQKLQQQQNQANQAQNLTVQSPAEVPPTELPEVPADLSAEKQTTAKTEDTTNQSSDMPLAPMLDLPLTDPQLHQ